MIFYLRPYIQSSLQDHNQYDHWRTISAPHFTKQIGPNSLDHSKIVQSLPYTLESVLKLSEQPNQDASKTSNGVKEAGLLLLSDSKMNTYRCACNFVASYVYKTHDLKQFSVNKALYYDLRERFGLKSQTAQSVLKTVIAQFKTILENEHQWIKLNFTKP